MRPRGLPDHRPLLAPGRISDWWPANQFSVAIGLDMRRVGWRCGRRGRAGLLFLRTASPMPSSLARADPATPRRPFPGGLPPADERAWSVVEDLGSGSTATGGAAAGNGRRRPGGRGPR